MNRAVGEIGGSVLVVSQFTLFADTRKGRRPSFIDAAPPEVAAPLIDQFAARLQAAGIPVATGQFQAHMQVALINDGPVTIWIDSAEPAAVAERAGRDIGPLPGRSYDLWTLDLT